MGGFEPTHIRIPKNDADFETKAVVLFRGLLKDPGVKRLGRSGQRQYGVDVVGYRDGQINRLVGVQCKLKGPNQKLTEKEVRDEVREALKYKPALSEYFIITTAPNDTALDQLAQTLSKQQKAKGRKIRIEVWGWGVLEERINEDLDTKNAFDPGWSPAVKETLQSLKQIRKSQTKQATAEQLEKISEKLDQRSLHEDRVPSTLAEEILEKELSRINARRGFFETNAALELEALAFRVINGDLAKAPGKLRAEALERAARTHAQPDTVAKAKKFHAEALKLNDQLDTSFYDALLPAGEGDPKASLRALKQLGTPQAKSAIFNQLFRLEGDEKALEWFKKSDLKITDLDPGGAQNLLLKRTVVRDYETALQEAKILPNSYLASSPALRSIRANLLLTSILPAAHRPILFEGMAINPRMLQFASAGDSQEVIGKAQADLETILALTPELKLTRLAPLLEEQILWLQLEQTAARAAAEARISEEIKDPAKTLRRVRLALAYKIPFNQDALARHLAAQKDVGDWTEDEQFAAFLLAWYNSDLTKLAEFFDVHRDDLFKQAHLSRGALASIEIEALSRVGRFADARRRLKEHRKQYFDADTAAHLDALISSVEKGNEAERLRQLYEASKDFTHLQLLVNTLVKQNDHRQLAVYAPVLLRESKRIEDYEVAQQALYIGRQYLQVVALAAEFPDLHKLNDDFIAFEGWSLFQLGRVMEARAIARALVARRADSNDRELDVNTAIESGDWGYLQAVVVREAARTDALDVKALLRLARMAFESGSHYVDRFRDAAIAAAPDSPEVFLSAYQLSIDRGDDHDVRTFEWLQKAVALSGPKGPIQHVNIKDIVDQSPGWNKKVDNVNTMTAKVQIPLYMAARAVNRQPVEFILGLALRNAKAIESKHQFPVLAFSGAKGPVDLSGVRRLALDNTSIFTLEYLGLLKKTIEAFDEIVIAPTALSSLFYDRQFIRFRQPSQVLKARQIKQLVTTGKLKVSKKDPDDAVQVSSEIDPELRMLLEKAAIDGATVVRSAPVTKLGSFLEETADMSAFSKVMTDTHSVLKFLQGKIAGPVAANAKTYLSQVDSGWTEKPELNSRSTVYLDQLTVTYLHQVGLLEALAGSVAQVYVSQDVENHSDAVISAAESSDELLQRVEHIRATLNEAIEKGNVKFSSRRQLSKAREDEDEDFGGSFPALDIMSNLTEVDAVVCDDRFLNKETFWADGKRQVSCVSTLDIINALNSRAVISEQQKYHLLHQLRLAGYYAVPIDPAQLLSELNRAGIKDGAIEETPELKALRLNLTLPARAKMFAESEMAWLDLARATIHGAIRTIWSNNDPLESVTARADWLIAIRPNPLEWVTDLNDDTKWAVAAQKTASQVGLSLVSPYSQRVREKEYGEWIELRLARPYRTHQLKLWMQAMDAVVVFLKGLLQPDAEIPKKIRSALVLRLVDAFHPTIKSDFLDTQDAASVLGISVARIVTLNGTEAVELKSFNGCLRAALAGRKNAEVLLANGTKAKAKLSLRSVKSGAKTAIVEFNGGRFAFGDVDLLAQGKSTRVSALRRVFSEGHLTQREEASWLAVVKKEPLSDAKYAELMDCLRRTPERFAASVAKPQTLSPATMVPTDLAYFGRLVGPIPDQTTFEGHLEGDLAAFQQELIGTGTGGLRKLALSGISQRLIPLEALRSFSAKQIAALLDASDPFTLVFGFELCRDRLGQSGRSFEALGTKFLQRLFSNDAWLKERCETFAACAVVTMVHLRPSANASSVPLYWYRLAVFAHAGLLADALKSLPKTEGFLKWAIQNFGGSYTWYTAVDVREESRWESDWIDPTALRSELIGRCANALWMLPEATRPKPWLTLVLKALDSVTPTFAAFFPGPLDGFLPVGVSEQRKADIKKVRSLLKKRSSFKQAPGLMVIAYGGGIDASLTKEILRLLEGSKQQLSKLATADQILRCCAYIAATTKDTKLAGVVISCCLRLVTPDTPANAILSLMLIAVRACAAHGNSATYYIECGSIASRFAYVTSSEAALDVRSTLEELAHRDPKFIAALGHAMAVLEAMAVSN